MVDSDADVSTNGHCLDLRRRYFGVTYEACGLMESCGICVITSVYLVAGLGELYFGQGVLILCMDDDLQRLCSFCSASGVFGCIAAHRRYDQKFGKAFSSWT